MYDLTQDTDFGAFFQNYKIFNQKTQINQVGIQIVTGIPDGKKWCYLSVWRKLSKLYGFEII